MIYCVTFGNKYLTEPHPFFPQAHPDGWVEVEAPGYSEARKIIYENLGDKWAFMYREDQIRKEYFPLGKIGELK
jgi:hypothetical protein